MRVLIRKEADAEYIGEMERSLAGRYGSFDSLGQKASIEKCSSPRTVDDYELWKAIKKGAEMEEEVIFHDYGLFGTMSESRAEILDYLSNHSVGSIKELALALNRDYKNIYFDVSALRKMELISLAGRGRKKAPVCRVREIEIELG